MDTLLTVLVGCATVCFGAACVYVIIALKRVVQNLDNVSKNIDELSSKTVPVLENLDVITGRMKNVAENIDEQVAAIGDSANAIKDMADYVVALERKVQERIEGPILDSVAFLAALVKGFRTFLDRVRA